MIVKLYVNNGKNGVIIEKVLFSFETIVRNFYMDISMDKSWN